MFSRLKLASIKNRFEKYCHEESKANILETFLNHEHEFDFAIESSRLQAEVNKHLEVCRVTEELAFVTSLGRELDSFTFLTETNDIRTITQNNLNSFKSETLANNAIEYQVLTDNFTTQVNQLKTENGLLKSKMEEIKGEVALLIKAKTDKEQAKLLKKN